MARGPLGVTQAGRPKTVNHLGPGTLDFALRSVRGGKRAVMEELAPAAVEFEPRMEPAVRMWQQLTPSQRRSVTLDDLAAEAELPKGEFFAAIVYAGYQLSHPMTDLILACGFPDGANCARPADGVVDRELLDQHLHEVAERVSAHDADKSEGNDAPGFVTDPSWFFQEDLDLGDPQRVIGKVCRLREVALQAAQCARRSEDVHSYSITADHTDQLRPRECQHRDPYLPRGWSIAHLPCGEAHIVNREGGMIMARGPLGVTRAGRQPTVKHLGPGTLDFVLRSVRGGKRAIMEELAPAAIEFEPRMEPAVRKWQELTPWQRRSVTLDDFADVASLPKSEFLAAVVRAGFESTHLITDLIVACAFPAAVAAAAKRAQHPDGVLDRQLLFEHMSALSIKTALERATEKARRAAGGHDTRGADSDLAFLRKDPDAGESRHDR